MAGTTARKAEQLSIVASGGVDATRSPGWEDVHLVPDALPEVDLDEVDCSRRFLDLPLRAPLLISGMTGGHPQAGPINARLARAAERHGVAMGVGSQRAALEDDAMAATFAVAREEAPSALVIANLGATQLIAQRGDAPDPLDTANAAIAMIRADALAIHLNVAEELVQIEGDRRTEGCPAAIEALCTRLDVPVLVKETGSGVSRRTAERCAEMGVRALDIGGSGGTSFATVEAIRAGRHGDQQRARLGRMLSGWGLPTVVSLVGAATSGLPIVASGGVRSGLDAAKAIALGADLVGVGRPLLEAALESDAAVEAWIEGFVLELRAVMTLCGAVRLADLKTVPRAVLGTSHALIEELDYGRDDVSLAGAGMGRLRR
ncbi:MAG: type 2 isopentenyl-diphosphate Delta-isomerase [Solirubrobacterales bacterium]